MSEHAKAHAAGRERFSIFLAELDEAQWATPTPACPAWDVKDVVAHVVGIDADMTGGRFPAGDVDAWIQEAVDARRTVTPRDLLAEWEQLGPAIDTLLTNMPTMMSDLLVGDIVTHEQDIRGALGLPGGREGATYDLAFEAYLNTFSGRVNGGGIPALRIRHDAGERVVGEGHPAATVSASTFELMRSLAGRRTPDQITAYEWEGDPSPYLAVFSNYGIPEAPIVE